ncbi:MAG TPA: S8 family serine peptidase [Coleofasciculaceae cyanobacterium]
MKAPEAWNWGFTGQGVTVAVIDSGVDIYHPDLDNNIWRNPGEVAGDGIDNDSNGYVDDLVGWNFGKGQNNNNVLPGTNDPGQSHGTHVAGTIAAEYNGFGTTGVAPNAKVMALRLSDVRTDTDGTGRFSNAGNLAQAIRYAVDNGAKVINMSLGWAETPEVIKALAYAASRNVITVSSAGNESQSSPGSPAKYATNFGISVGAVDSHGNLANFSNWSGFDSRMQHVVAPGVDIVSTVPRNTGQYNVQSGTSMAAPHVAGVVALMLSANPYLTHAQIRYILTQSATG